MASINKKNGGEAFDPELKELRDSWCAKLDDENLAHKQFRDLANDADDEYYAVACPDDDAVSSTSVAYPIYWSIVQVLHGRIFSQPPSPDVRKRNPDEPGVQPISAQAYPQADAILAGLPAGAVGGNPPNQQPGGMGPGPTPQGPPQPGQPPAAGMLPSGGPPPAPPLTVDDNKISQLLERALQWVIDVTPFDSDSHAAVNDLLVEGGGVAKVEMDVETAEIPVPHPETGEPLNELDDDGNEVMDDEGNPKPQMQTVVIDKSLRLRHFAFARQFRWEPHQHWSTVSWIAFMHGMTADEIEDEWGVELSNEGGSARRPNSSSADADSKKPQADKYDRLFDVYEIWDKTTREVIFVCPNHDQAFEVRPDPLKLKDFYPCPKPMMLNIRGDDLVPQPDFSKCESLFKTANEIYRRIDSLVRQIKDVGFYDSAFKELAQIMTAKDGFLIPIANLTKRLNDINPGNANAGYDAIVCKQDNKNKVDTLQMLVQQLAQIEDMIWKSYGVADIERGESNPNETATAQTIKAQWADIRVGQRIRIVALFFRDVFRIMADVIATFPPDVLFKMTGITLNDAEMQVLRSDVGRSYAIDVESDSTVVQDQAAVQAERTQMLQAVTGYLKEIGPMMQQNQIPGDLGKELLLFVVNTYKSGRQIEDAINNLPGTMQQLAQQQTTISQLQEQMQNLVKQNQAQAKALQAVNAVDQQAKQADTAIKVQAAPVENAKKAAEAQRTQAEAEHTQVLTAAEAQGIAHDANSPHPTANPTVVPFAHRP